MSIDTSTWERTPRGKLICPDCGATGWNVQPGSGWLRKHESHTDCEDCGRTVPTATMNFHKGRHCPARELEPLDEGGLKLPILDGREVIRVPMSKWVVAATKRQLDVEETGVDPWRVAATEFGPDDDRKLLSTVFLGTEHPMIPDDEDLPPINCFETMLFPDTEVMGRMSTWDEAEMAHARILAALEAQWQETETTEEKP